MEIAHLDGERARGTQIGVAYELRGPTAEVRLDGADFFDLAFSPLFNSLHRYEGLAELVA